MKKFMKALFAILAMLVVGASFVSCKDEEDDAEIIASFSGTDKKGWTAKTYFYSDGKVVRKTVDEGNNEAGDYFKWDIVRWEGTYSGGSPDSDIAEGTITITKAVTESELTAYINSCGSTINVTNKEVPLRDLSSPRTATYSRSGTTLTLNNIPY